VGRGDWAIAFFLLLLTLCVYQPAWEGKPVWDDDAHITRPELRTLEGLSRIWIEPGATQQYYPVVYSAFWIAHKFWGDNPLGYHVSNVVLHVCCAVLLVRILRQLRIRGAWLAGAIFALHPVHVESVAWISELKNTLSALFYLSAALVYLEFDQTRKRPQYFLALGLFLCGLASKTVIATLPAALGLLFWWRRGTLSWKRDVAPLLPFFGTGLVAGLFTAWMERRFVGAQGAEFDFTFVERCLIAGRAFWFYMGKILWPKDLAFIYPRWHVSQAIWWQYLFPAAALLLLVCLWRLRRGSRGPITALLYFAVTLLPALGFLNVYPFRYSFVADHFQYLASIGPIVLASAGIIHVFDWLGEPTARLRPAFCGLLVLSLCALSWRQSAMFRDGETLWWATLSRNPNSWLAHNNLGTALLKKGQATDAFAHFQRAVEINPGAPEPRNNLGNRLRELGRLDESAAQLEKALQIKPDYAEAYNNLGNTLARMGRPSEAMARYDQALRIDPNYAEAHNNLGNILLDLRRADEAVAHFKRALQLKPGYAAPHYNLGNQLLQNGDIEGAIAQFKKALELDPNYTAVHIHLGVAWLRLGRMQESLLCLEKALQLDPASAEAHNNLGNTLLRMGRSEKALGHLLKAVESDPNNVSALNNAAWLLATSSKPAMRDAARALELAERAEKLTRRENPVIGATLAAALAEGGRFAEAVEAAQIALKLAIRSGNSALAEAIRSQIVLYESGVPSREDNETLRP
jgi:tetratricopeptide (TPR) repeat protein